MRWKILEEDNYFHYYYHLFYGCKEVREFSFYQRRNHQLHRIKCDHCHGSSSAPHRKIKKNQTCAGSTKRMVRKRLEIAPGITIGSGCLIFWPMLPEMLIHFNPKDTRKIKGISEYFYIQLYANEPTSRLSYSHV